MRSLLRSSFFHRFAGGFALGAAIMLVAKPVQAMPLVAGLLG